MKRHEDRHCGLGTVGGGVAKGLARNMARSWICAPVCRSNWLPSAIRDAQRRDAFDAPAKLDDIKALAASNADLIVELIGGENGAAPFLVEEALKGRQARRHRQTRR